jgi:glycosyltransferase involved in cell wall biosynthesis
MLAESFVQSMSPSLEMTRSALGRRPRLMFVINADWFFVSHRLALGVACAKAGFDVSVCAGKTDAHALIERAGLRFIPLPIDRGGTNPRTDLATLTALIRTYRREKPDIVHHVTVKPIVYGSLAARFTRVPAVVNAVSGLGYAFIPRERDRLRHRALRQLVTSLYRVAFASERVRAIFQNEADRNAFVDAKLVARDKTHLIHGSGVDFARFQPRPLPTDAPVALLPARLLWDKGIAEFVEAARQLRPRFPHARFVLLGRTDPDNPAAVPEATVREWVDAKIVEWWGHCDHAEMPEVLSRAHVVVLPSYREGLPLALAEAAALGRASVATDVPGCRDTVRDGETGWLVPPRDSGALTAALEAAVRDRDELERRSANAVSFARERFGLDGVIASTLKVYGELLSKATEQRS